MGLWHGPQNRKRENPMFNTYPSLPVIPNVRIGVSLDPLSLTPPEAFVAFRGSFHTHKTKV